MAAALGLLVILGVTAYNMYQENKYRRKVREQFGHSDKDALLEGQPDSVRDGRGGAGVSDGYGHVRRRRGDFFRVSGRGRDPKTEGCIYRHRGS